LFEIIDLSQEIFTGMAVFPGLPEVKVTVHLSHEELEGVEDSDVVSPAVNLLELGEHTGTHVDAISHMGRRHREPSIDTMPLTSFYTEGICLDLSHKGLMELIEVEHLERALADAGLEVKRGDTVLLCTDHYRRAYGTDDWHRGPGVSVAATHWLGKAITDIQEASKSFAVGRFTACVFHLMRVMELGVQALGKKPGVSNAHEIEWQKILN
jgi:kynurenine formamidase